MPRPSKQAADQHAGPHSRGIRGSDRAPRLKNLRTTTRLPRHQSSHRRYVPSAHGSSLFRSLSLRRWAGIAESGSATVSTGVPASMRSARRATLARLGGRGAETRELVAGSRPQPGADVVRQRAAVGGEPDRGDPPPGDAAADVHGRLSAWPGAADRAVDVRRELQRRGHLPVLLGAVDRTERRRDLQAARAQRADDDLLDAPGALAGEPEHRDLAGDARARRISTSTCEPALAVRPRREHRRRRFAAGCAFVAGEPSLLAAPSRPATPSREPAPCRAWPSSSWRATPWPPRRHRRAGRPRRREPTATTGAATAEASAA